MNSMHVKILKRFSNPLTNRMAEVGETMNVPQGRFWFKRLNDKDCELAAKKSKKVEPKLEMDEPDFSESKKNKKGK